MDEEAQRKAQVKDKLLSLYAELLDKYKRPEPPSFTNGNKEADSLLRSNPFAYLMAASIDRGAHAEYVWEIPWRLQQELGALDPDFFSLVSVEELEEILRSLPRKPRYPYQAARTIISLAKLVLEKFQGKASNIWQTRSVIEVLRSLQEIWGVGPGISNMTVRILVDEEQYKPAPDELRWIDVKPDTNLTRVFYRAGLSPNDSEGYCKQVARELHPEFPGALDHGAWTLGREVCHKHQPKCHLCVLNSVCPKKGI